MSPLLAAVNSIKSPAQIELERARIELHGYGVPSQRISRTGDVPILLATLIDHGNGTLPSEAEQNERYEALKRTGMLSLAAKVINQWLEASMRQSKLVDSSILIKLAYCQRHSGNLEGALKTTAPVVERTPGVAMSANQKSILAAERAAVLMDLYESRRDRNLLVEARRCAGISSATSQSQEASFIYRRLAKHEGES